MVTFLFGKYGTGKSAYILEKISENVARAERAFWLVPEQKVLICERNLASQLPPSAQLYAEALSFTRLANKVFRECGGLKYNYIDRSGKSLIMYRALCEIGDSLAEYKIKKGQERGYVALFLDAIGELKSYLVSPKKLKSALDALTDRRLKGKIADLVRVFEKYNELLSERFDDPYDDLASLADKLREHRIFEGASVYINSFNGFTGAQLGVIYEIFSQAKEIYISLDMEKSCYGRIQYAKLSTTLDTLRHMCTGQGIRIAEKSFDTDLLHENKCIEYLSDNIWSFGARAYEGEAEGIELVRPSDELEECEYVASKIKELIMRGARYGEIAVIMRSADTYRGIIDYCFEKYDIPFYLSVGADVISKPLIKMLYSAISASVDFNTRDIVSFIKSGYADISVQDANELESYIYRWGIYGKRFINDDYWSANPDGYVTEPTEAQMARLAQINDTRARVLEILAPLSRALQTPRSATALCEAVYELIVSLKIREKLRAEMADCSPSEAKELSQLYRAVMNALSTIADIMPNEQIGKEGLLCALTYVLEGARVGSIPTGEDNVTIGEASSLRTEQIKYAFVLGVCEGAFPQNVTSASFFSDSDKRALEGVEIILSAKTDIRADDELLNFKNSIAVASKYLLVSSPRADLRGAKKDPSIAYNRIKTLFPSLKDSDKKGIATIDKIYTPRIALEHISGDSDEAMAIRALLKKEEVRVDFSNENERLSPELARELFGDRLYLSQSKIEKFVSCHFQYYCNYVLGIKESEKISFGSKEVGVLTHSVLEHFLKRVRAGALELKELDDIEIEREINQITQDYISALYPQSEPPSKLRHLFSRLRRSIVLYIRELASELLQSDFAPELFELKFSRENGIRPLEFDVGNGCKITLSGVVDRVDLYREGDIAYVRVVDYKTGEKSFSFSELEKGLELQMLIYLFTLCKMGDGALKGQLLGEAKQIKPAGIMYFPMRLGKATIEAEVDLSSEEADRLEREKIGSLVRRNGVFLDNESVILAQDKAGKGRYLPEKGRNKKYYLDEQGFDALYDKLRGTLEKIGKELFDGEARAIPLDSSENGSCKYCQNKAICRRRAK